MNALDSFLSIPIGQFTGGAMVPASSAGWLVADSGGDGIAAENLDGLLPYRAFLSGYGTRLLLLNDLVNPCLS